LFTILSTPYPNYDVDGSVMEVSEPVNKWNLFQQLSAHFAFIALWAAFACAGEDPILGPPMNLTHQAGEPYSGPLPNHDIFFAQYLLLLCFVIVHQTIHMQVAHVTLSRYTPWSKLWIFATLYTAISLLESLIYPNMQTKVASLILLACVSVGLAHYLVNIIQEMCVILRIKIFTVKDNQKATVVKNQVEDRG